MELVTREQWLKLRSYTQGYVFYMQAEHKGSELKGAEIPHAKGTHEYDEFMAGQQQACLDAQDSEE